ncbi:MAG: hypothetical protein GXY38_08940 [Planctomycetes bacterium]|jgi:hypothetical protein|nr:hypothetical protein [Planctomycetota bacterium]
MILSNRNINSLVDALLCELDDEARRLASRCQQLDDMSSALLAGDDAALEQLLSAMDTSALINVRTDGRLSDACRRLGDALGCRQQDCRLARIMERLDPSQALALSQRRESLTSLVDRLRQKHMEAALLLGECRRLNSLMLECVMPRGQSVTVYGAAGTENWQTHDANLDTEQ